MLKRLICLLMGLLMLAGCALAEAPSLEELMAEIDREAKASPLWVGEPLFEVSPDRRSIFIDRPEVQGSAEYTIAYNIYDADSNPVNYFYSLEERVAATPGYAGLFNVFIVVTDTASGDQNIQNIGWIDLLGPDDPVPVQDPSQPLSVGQATFEVSPDGQSIFIDRPAISGGSGDLLIAYNLYDADGNAINYFYSRDARVAVTPGFAGLFNVFIVVTDVQTGESDTQNIGWLMLEGPEVDPGDWMSIKVWVTERATVLTENMISDFILSYPEYSDFDFTVEAVNEFDVLSMLPYAGDEGADIFVFPQDVIPQLYVSGYLSDVPAAWHSVASANDAAAVKAATYGGKLVAYPITSDNGYFLYYDKDVITDPGDLSAILRDCEAAGREFHMELTSGWYSAAFFFGGGCSLSYEYDGAQLVGFAGNVATSGGLQAVKAMREVAASPAFINNSVASMAKNAAALISGTWDGETVSQLWAHPGAAKMPAMNGMQLGSYGGFKLIGVADRGYDYRLEAAHCLAAFLAGREAQEKRQNALGWLASNPAARARANASWYHNALAAQMSYAVPQGPIPGGFWDLTRSFGESVINGDMNGLSDSSLTQLLKYYQSDLEKVK